jgi:hypothetical protein
MRTLRVLLRDGLRLSLLRAPRSTPLGAGFGTFLCLFVLATAIDVLWQWPSVDPPLMLNAYGIQTALSSALLTLGTSAVLVAIARRNALLWTVAAWLAAAFVLPNLLLGGLQWLAQRQENLSLLIAVGWLAYAWVALIVLRLSFFLAPRPRPRALGAAAAGALLLLVPWLWLDPQRILTTDWAARSGVDDQGEWHEPGSIEDAERTIYAQPERLDEALGALAPQRPGTIDLYAVAFGGDASENVFRNEVEYVEQLFATRFDARGHTLVLLNHPESVASRPLASATNLERALLALGTQLDRQQDILFLYLTSHGSEDHEFYINQPPLPLDPLTPRRLRAALDASGIRWRVIVVSACYSGGYIDALRDPHTLVLTAASADRPSFGCGAASRITYFGKAFLAQALNEHVDFVAAFEQARVAIRGWERKRDFQASRPQIAQGEHIAAHLQRWRAGFEPGPAVRFAPAGDGNGGTTKAAPAPD